MDEREARHGLIQWHGTTIIGVSKNGKTVIAGDGQVSMGHTVMKANARKVRRLGKGARSSPVSPGQRPMLTLFERSKKTRKHHGQLLAGGLNSPGMADRKILPNWEP